MQLRFRAGRNGRTAQEMVVEPRQGLEFAPTVVAADAVIAVLGWGIRDDRHVVVAECDVDLFDRLVRVDVALRLRGSRLLLRWSCLVVDVVALVAHVAPVLVEGRLALVGLLTPVAMDRHVGGLVRRICSCWRREGLRTPIKCRLLVIEEALVREEARVAVLTGEWQGAVAAMGLVQLERVGVLEGPVTHATNRPGAAAIGVVESMVAQLAVCIEGIAADTAVITRRGDPRGRLLRLLTSHHW